MKKRVLSTMLVVVMLLSAMSFAFAEDECCDEGHEHEVLERVSAYCPVCGDVLSYRTYNVTRNGSGNICYQVVTYGQAYCSQHGDVYGAEELTSMDYEHDWVSDHLHGGVICRKCGKRGTVITNSIECSGESIYHNWTTDRLDGSARCTMCNFRWSKPLDEPLKQEDTICPNHRTFHTWIVDEETGDIICETCGEVGLAIVVD